MLGLLACVGHPACDGLVNTSKHQGFALTAIGAQSFGCLEYLFSTLASSRGAACKTGISRETMASGTTWRHSLFGPTMR